MTLVLSVLEQGMIYAIMALGIYITYTILDFPDLTVDGSFPLGAALSAVLITKGVNPILTLLVTFAAGAFAGMLTGIIHVKLKVRDLLSGIIMMTALYTVNLRIAGRANLPIYNMTTLFDNDFVRNVFKGGLAQFSNVIIILVITLVMKFLLDWYMSTKSGYLLRAVGDNETIVTSMGVDKGITKIIGLAIANGLCSLSGCILHSSRDISTYQWEPEQWLSDWRALLSESACLKRQHFACDLECCYRSDCIQGLCGNRYKAWYAVERFEAHYSGIVPHHSGAWNG